MRTMLGAKPGLQRALISGLHETDNTRLEPTLRAFTILAETLADERLRDLARKLMWMLNDESGNHCPNASLALAAVAEARADIVAPHLASLKVHVNDPGDHMASRCAEAVRRIETALGTAS
ncbi:hypothetical protein KQI52_13165 [bacterium]|nr:hypothetical protein [bacterium]